MNSRPETRNPKLTAHTRRRIFAAFKERGILDEDYRHEIQRDITGKESLKDFSEIDGARLLTHLLGNPKPETRNPKLRRRYTRPDGIIQINVAPTATQRGIRFAYFLMKQIIERERGAHADGIIPRPENWSDNAGARLDAWAHSENVSHGEADRISQLMQEELDRMLYQLRNRTQWLDKKRAAAMERRIITEDNP